MQLLHMLNAITGTLNYVSSTNNLEREHISKLQYASIYPAVKDDLYLNYI